MKRLIAILAMLLLGPAMAQESPYANAIQTGNLVPDWSFDGPTGTTPQGWTLQGNNQSGGAIQPGCGGVSNQGKCFIFSYMGATLSTEIDLSSYQTNSFEFYFDFFYRMNCNNSIGGYCANELGPKDMFGASVQFFTTNGEAGAFNFIPIGPDYFRFPMPGVNDQDYKAVGWYSSQSSEYLFTSAIISFYGRDTGFWAGYYGPALDRVNFRIGYLPPPEEPTITTDCTLTPSDPNCAVLVYTDPALIADALVDEVVADATTNDTTDETLTGSDDGSDDGTEVVEEEEEEVLVANEDNTDLEEMLSDDEESTDEEETATVTETTTATNEPQATYRELTDEEKAQILADSIAKNTLEMALSIAENASSNTSNTTTVESTTNKNVASSNVETVEIITADNKNENEQQSTESSSDIATDLLETGRSLNATSMAATQQQTEQSASDSITQAESIAIGSAESKINDIVIENVVASTVDTSSNNTITNTNDGSDTIVEQKTVETITEEVVANNIEQNTDTSNQTIDSFVDVMNLVIAPTTETKDEDLEFVQSILAQTEQKVDESVTTFDEDEKVTIQNDPNLANAFNVVPNTTNLEILGVLSNKQDEKSDAEKRAEQVVAANKEQQEEINKNYMDADQSGIVAAMGNDTDVTSYRSAMLNDNNIWYKPEDIYKNIVYKDNVRGAYFLEKGNTDTYKKMVEEQYK